eukprot:6460146-Amphidinium_carterae.3
MAIPNISSHVTMSINTNSPAGQAVASRLGLNIEQENKACTIALCVHAGHHPTRGNDNHQNSNNRQPCRRSYQTSTVNNNHITS